MKKRIRHTQEFEFCIEGSAKFDGYKEYISEKVRAYSEYQAFWRLGRRLERQRNKSVYLGDCAIYIMKVFFPDGPTRILEKRKRKTEQLVFHFF